MSLLPPRSLLRPVAGALAVSLVASLAATATSPATTSRAGTTAAAGPALRADELGVGDVDAQNVVVVQLDDVAWDTVRTMPTWRALAPRAAVFTNATVGSPNCGPSRATMLTGLYAHNHGTRANRDDRGPVPGGWPGFVGNGNDRHTWATAIQLFSPEHRVGFLGKTINQYKVSRGTRIPPGFDYWDPFSPEAYTGWGFRVPADPEVGDRGRIGDVTRFGTPPAWLSPATRDALYAENVMSRRLDGFLDSVRGPFVVSVNSFAAHARSGRGVYNSDKFPAALGDRGPQCGTSRCATVRATGLPGYDDPNGDNVAALPDGTPVTGTDLDWRPDTLEHDGAKLDSFRRQRAQMVMSADRTLRRVLGQVDLNTTYVIITSDNGFHLGQNRLVGKNTPYDPVMRVPLMVLGPGVVPGVRDRLVSNVDLAPTIEQLAGVPAEFVESGADGRSLVPLLKAPRSVRTWRDVVFAERYTAPAERINQGAPPSWTAARTKDALLVRYDDQVFDDGRLRYAYEFYTGLSRPGGYERANLLNRPMTNQQRARFERMRRAMQRFDVCGQRADGVDDGGGPCQAIRVGG